MRELLGTPHQEQDGQYRFRFSDSCIQVDSEDKLTVDAVSVGLTRIEWTARFHIWPIHNLILGKTSFREILEPEDEIEFDSSTKFYHFYITKYYGFPGLYWNYGLGVLECPGIWPDSYHWSPSQQSREEIPKQMKINWACVTRLDNLPAFNYFGFM